MVDRRIRRRGIRWMPKASQVAEARRCVRAGIPIHPRWLPFLSPADRERACLSAPVE